MPRVTVGLVAGGFPELEPPYHDQRLDLPYRDRATVELDVENDDSLFDVFERALAEFQVTFTERWEGMGTPAEQVHFIAFYKPEDEDGVPLNERLVYADNLMTVPGDGRIRWGVGLEDARVGDL